MKSGVMLAALLSALFVGPSGGRADTLHRGFLRPPDDARPWVYWVWMDGTLNRQGITADLEAMRQAGIGGAIIMEVSLGLPRGPVGFMSPEWRDLFKHAVADAKRLGLEISLITGPGWTGSGGPWVRPEHSMQHIVSSTTTVAGPGRFTGMLPRPARRPAFFGDGLLPQELERAKDEFYRDEFVLAFPTPAEGPILADIDEKALYVRAPYSSQPNVRPFLPAPADFPALRREAIIDPTRVVDITSSMEPDGRIAWDVPEGSWTIMRFGRTSTGANTRPAPAPGLGLECDKMDAAALDAHFEAFIGALLREVGPHTTSGNAGWTTLHLDSWEMGAQNWTGAFRQEFQRRRGYDLLRYLPAVSGAVVESREVTERFLWDFRLTAQELVLENHAGRLKQLGRRAGLALSIEPYDMTPVADMSLGAYADVPMGEFWLYGFDTSYSVIEATSTAHTNGRPVVAAEAFTSNEEERWQAYPGSMKALGDWAFSAGINRFVIHRYQHQPWPDLRPGMTMGPYGIHWERTQTWWDMVPAYHTYLSRCQFMLRQGKPVADVLFLVAEGAPHVFRPPSSAVHGDPPDRLGYGFDASAPEVLRARAAVKDGRLVFPDGMEYRVLVLPERETMTPDLLRKLTQLVEAGATVIGPRPRKSPSLAGYPGCDVEVERLAGDLWGGIDGTTVTERSFGRGRVIWKRGRPGGAETAGPRMQPAETDQYGDFAVVTRVLADLGVPPDFEAEAAIRYAHRQDGGTDIYFLANPEDRSVSARCTFRVDGRRPELWDAISGETRELPEVTRVGGRTSVNLHFEPHQSFFVIFRKPATDRRPVGRNFPELEAMAEVGGPWEVSFDPRWGGPETITFQQLDDWSQRPEEGIRYYSGKATYRRSFDRPAILGRVPSSGRSRIWLDLGAVKNVARVRLNGRDLGVLWCAPWRVEIGGAMRAVDNRLEIEVANLWPNRMIGDEQLPPDSEFGRAGNLVSWPSWLTAPGTRPFAGRYTFSTWNHFARESRLLPSGLLGPVRLLRQPRK